MFIVAIIAQLGALLHSWSQLVAARLDKNSFDNG